LQDTIKHGLPGDHHFYITLQTNHPDVVIPPYLRERYEDDMTIVMQNQFWDLVVDEDHFEISLSFNRSKEHLYIPFDALLGFFDPSVDFGLHFNSEIDNDSDIEIIEEDEIKDTIAVVEQEDGEEKDNIVTLDAFRKK
ncbi:MAG: ClpXP protease specificity-enhancing factor SspB, partial [Emcibacteraceae bacterium]|nr:ClpXP protease specificity-enhancing factor SspB [Emcibacteraceae bacterium]